MKVDPNDFGSHMDEVARRVLAQAILLILSADVNMARYMVCRTTRERKMIAEEHSMCALIQREATRSVPWLRSKRSV